MRKESRGKLNESINSEVLILIGELQSEQEMRINIIYFIFRNLF